MEIIIFFVIAGLLYYGYKKLEKKLNDQTLLGVKAAVSQHSRTLAMKYHQTIYKDDYGVFKFDKWEREAKYFIENVLIQDNTTYQFLNGGSDSYDNNKRFYAVSDIVFSVAQEEYVKMTAEAPDEHVEVDDFTGEEFESYCVSLLNAHGWDANKTKSSGDQGVDIIATLNGITAVIQCKRYSKPVGNAAVQEAIAGKKYARAQFAAVVTNSSFTKSARQLAQAANIYLLHYTELEAFTNLIFEEE